MSEPILNGLVLLLIKATVLILGSLCSYLIFFRATATFRHALLTSGLVALLFLPLVVGVVPEWRPALLETSLTAPVSTLSVPSGPGIVGRETRPVGSEATNAPTYSPSAPVFGVGAWGRLLWLMGTLVLLTRLFLGDFLLRRRIQACRQLSGESALEAARIARELEIRKGLSFVVDEKLNLPLVWGIWRPFILLPASCVEWNKEKFRMIVLHELAHVRRRDLLVQKLALLVRALYWFLPPVWLAVRALKRESEKACDELVLSRGIQPGRYARELVQAAARMAGKPVPEVAFGLLHTGHLESRVKAVLRAPKRMNGLNPRWGFSTGLSLALMLPLAMVVPQMTATIEAGSPAQTTRLQERQESGDRDATLSWREGRVRYRLQMQGVRVAPDYREIESIAPGGYFHVWEEGTEQESRLEIEPGAGGELVARYWVGGEERTSGSEEFLEEALMRLRDLDGDHTRLRHRLSDLGARLDADLDLGLGNMSRALRGLRLEGLSDTLASLRFLDLEPLRFDLGDLQDRMDEARFLREDSLDQMRDALQDLSLDLHMNLEPHLDQMKNALGDLRIEMEGVREEIEQRRQAFADALVDLFLADLEGFRSRLSPDQWRNLELQLTLEAERLIRRSGIHVEDEEWQLDLSGSAERRFQQGLNRILTDYLEATDGPGAVASRLLELVRSFRMQFD